MIDGAVFWMVSEEMTVLFVDLAGSLGNEMCLYVWVFVFITFFHVKEAAQGRNKSITSARHYSHT